MAAKKGLGKGLDSLISKKLDTEIKRNVEQKEENVSRETLTLPLSKIEPNRDQPRRHFDEEALQQLADSIKVHGIIQPLVVRPVGDRYEIIAGERRFRAAHIAGLREVPVIVREYSEQELYEIALIENLQRVNLNPIEEAVGYKKLISEYKLTQEQVSERVAKSRTEVTNKLRLLKLDDRVQQMLIDEKLTAGHARALLALSEDDDQYKLAEEIVKKKLSVREVEKRIQQSTAEPKKEPSKEEKRKAASTDAIYAAYEEKLKETLGTKVSVNRKGNNSGKIEIEYYDADEFERLMQLLGVY